MNNTLKADDEPAHLFEISTHHTILFFTDRGRVYKLKGYDIPESGRYAKGMPVINYISIVGGERVTATISVKDLAKAAGLNGATAEQRWPCRYLLTWKKQ